MAQPFDHIHPPKWADRFLSWFCRKELLEEIKGDLHEYYLIDFDERGRKRANLSYWYHVFNFLRPFAINRKNKLSNFIIMYRSYFKFAWRNMFRHRVTTLMNLLSLSVGMACFIFVTIYLRGELSYDRFHADSDRIHRVVIDLIESNGTALPDATTPPALAPAMVSNFPEVETATRIFPNWSTKFLMSARENLRFYEEGFMRTDSTFFNVFTFPFLYGNPQTALNAPDKMVLTRSMALKYFNEVDVVGENLTLHGNADRTFRISAVIEDVPKNSHFKFDFLSMIDFDGVNENWGWWNYYTYVKLMEGTTAEQIEPRLAPFYENARPNQEQYAPIYTQAITDIHLHSNLKWELEANGNMANIYIFAALGAFVLLISCLNYLNITVADSLKRLKEVGVRKVLGAHKQSLIGQFLIESLLIVLFSIIVGGVLAEVFFRTIGKVLGQEVSLLDVENLQLFIMIALTGLIVGVLAGLYPALHMSSFKVVNAVKGIFNKSGKSALGLRKTLLVIQFAISVVMIVGTMIVFRQLGHMQNADLGFEPEQVVVIENADRVSNQETFRTQLMALPQVKSSAISGGLLGGINSTTSIGHPDRILMNYMAIDPSFIETLDLELIEGRNFSKDRPTDAQGLQLIVNEKAMKEMGVSMEDVGKPIPILSQRDSIITGTILGVVKDFHFTNFKLEIKPFAFLYREGAFGYLSLKMNTENLSQTMVQVENIWNELAPGTPFEYFFLNQTFQDLHEQEAQLSKILLYLTFLAIFIAFMGMFAIANMTIKDRLKEIAVRKVLGASISRVSGLITVRFLWLVLIANLIGIPISYYLMNQWLAGFAYRTDLGLVYFLLALLSTLLVAGVTVGFQSVRAAVINPVKSLRTD